MYVHVYPFISLEFFLTKNIFDKIYNYSALSLFSVIPEEKRTEVDGMEEFRLFYRADDRGCLPIYPRWRHFQDRHFLLLPCRTPCVLCDCSEESHKINNYVSWNKIFFTFLHCVDTQWRRKQIEMDWGGGGGLDFSEVLTSKNKKGYGHGWLCLTLQKKTPFPTFRRL